MNQDKINNKMAYYREYVPYTFHVACPQRHIGYIIGRGGRGIKFMIEKWVGKILDVRVSHPAPQFGRPDSHITIIGEDKAVHLLALEMNEMIKISMTRTETMLKCEVNKADGNLQNQNAKDLKIAMLEEELRRLREVDEEEEEEEDEEEEEMMVFTGVWKGANKV